MSRSFAAPEAVHPGTGRAPVERSTLLGPAEDFPVELAELGLVELQVLHSRICLQLHREYLDVPEGAHPVTLDRHQELVAELETRRSRPPATAHG